MAQLFLLLPCLTMNKPKVRITMRKQIILASLIISATFWGCQKQEDTEILVQQYVAFSISQVDPSLLKNSMNDVICPLDEAGNLKTPTIAEVVVNGVSFYPEVYMLNGKLYTQTIKLTLPEGAEFSYNISKFALLEHIGGDIIMATPTKGSFYAAYVNSGVDFDIAVTPFGKTEVPVEVLCFMPQAYELYGFDKPETTTDSLTHNNIL
jgi:hypothetical protein